MTDINSHVDAVIAYVDCDDAVWQTSFSTYASYTKETPVRRFRTYGCLDLQIHLIRKNMPFIKDIYVIVSSMSQIEKYKNLDIIPILHSDIIPYQFLPTFNS